MPALEMGKPPYLRTTVLQAYTNKVSNQSSKLPHKKMSGYNETHTQKYNRKVNKTTSRLFGKKDKLKIDKPL